MKLVTGLIAVFAIMVGISQTALSASHMMSSHHQMGSHMGSMTIRMHQQNGSGENGTATLTSMGNRTRIVIGLDGENTSGLQPAHVHPGTCSNLNPVPRYPLKDVILGKSNTVIDAPMSMISSGHWSINVHESAKELKKYVSCGTIR